MADKLRLYSSEAAQQTAVSNIFIDNFMPQANGEYVKIYLQLLRCVQHSCEIASLAALADRFDLTESDVLRALRYWERQGLLLLEFNGSEELTGIRLASPGSLLQSMGQSAASANAAYTVPATAPTAAPLPKSDPVPRQYTAEELNAFGSNQELQELFFIIQTYMQHPLSDSDTNMILFWYEELGFAAELVEYLVEYCITKGHYSTSYMNKVALGWARNEITTVAQAKEHAQMHSQIYYAVIKALGIHGRSLVPSENELIRKWTKDYGFSQELIEEACARTISATHQPSFEYTDSILTRWNADHIRTMQDVKKADEAYSQQKKKPAAGDARTSAVRPAPNKFNNFNQRSYDEAELEKILLNSSVGNSSH